MYIIARNITNKCHRQHKLYEAKRATGSIVYAI